MPGILVRLDHDTVGVGDFACICDRSLGPGHEPFVSEAAVSVKASWLVMALQPRNRYVLAMSTKKHTSACVTVRRDAKTGRMIPAGYGALKDQYVVRDGVDITKPIFEQVRRASRGRAAPKKLSQG